MTIYYLYISELVVIKSPIAPDQVSHESGILEQNPNGTLSHFSHNIVVFFYPLDLFSTDKSILHECS